MATGEVSQSCCQRSCSVGLQAGEPHKGVIGGGLPHVLVDQREQAQRKDGTSQDGSDGEGHGFGDLVQIGSTFAVLCVLG